MFTFRGDAHKLYLKLKKITDKEGSVEHVKELTEITELQDFYRTIESHILEKIYYRMLKEKNGSGMIPIFVSSIPWLIFLFTKQIQEFLFKEGGLLWAIFAFIYLLILTTSVILHFYEKSWAAVHIEIILKILEERRQEQ